MPKGLESVTQGYKKVNLGPKGYEVPERWDKKLIKDVCQNLDNKRIPITESERKKGDIPYYGATGCIDYVDDYIFDETLVLVGEDGADWSNFASTSFIITGKSWVNNHAHILKCKKIHEKYFSEFLNLIDLNYAIVGTNRGKLNKKDLMKIEILYPPLSEQKKIAEILSTVDKAISQTDEIIEKTRMLKKGLVQKLLIKGIGHKNFKTVKLGPKEIEIPEEWNVINFGKIYYKRTEKAKNNEDGFRYIGLEHLESKNIHIERFDSNGTGRSSSRFFKKGDVLYGKLRPYLEKAAIAPFDGICSTDIIPIYSGKFSTNDYLIYLIHSHFMKSRTISTMEGTNLPRTSWNSLKSYKIPLPLINEQKRIASILSNIDKKILKEKKYKQKLEEIKKGLMQDLLTGKKRVKVDNN